MKKGLLIAFGLFLLMGACSTLSNSSEPSTTIVADTSSVNSTSGTSIDSTSSTSLDSALSGSETETATETTPTVVEDNEVTLEEYQKIKNGMTYEEVAKIIGFEGTELSSSEFGGIKTVMYMWQNDDGSNMNAMFENNKLVSKAQFGLK